MNQTTHGGGDHVRVHAWLADPEGLVLLVMLLLVPSGSHPCPGSLLQVPPAPRTRSLLRTPTLASFHRVHPSFPHYLLTKQRKHTSVRSFTGEVRQNTEHKLVISHARRRPRTDDFSPPQNMNPGSSSSLGRAREGGSDFCPAAPGGIIALPVMTRCCRWRSLLLQIHPRWLHGFRHPRGPHQVTPPGGRMCCSIPRRAGDYVTALETNEDSTQLI